MAEDLVTVSVKMSRALFARVQTYARERRFSVSELLREGVEWRLGEQADPLAYRYGATGNTSTGEMEPPADQERAAVERHQAIMRLLSEIRAHHTVIPVIPPAPVASVESRAPVIPVVPRETVAPAVPVETVIPVIPAAHAFDPTKFVLGDLCHRGHDYAGTGQSLRYRAKRECVQCKRGNSRASKAKARGAIMHAGAMLLLLLFASSVTAAELPTETDLRAAYCIHIVQGSIDAFQPSPTDSAALEEDLAAARADIANKLRRLKLYLVPRLSHLELLGLATANQRAKEDLAQSEHYSTSCWAKCQQSANKDRRASAEVRASADGACKNTCNAKDPLLSRFKECHDLRWLPY